MILLWLRLLAVILSLKRIVSGHYWLDRGRLAAWTKNIGFNISNVKSATVGAFRSLQFVLNYLHGIVRRQLLIYVV